MLIRMLEAIKLLENQEGMEKIVNQLKKKVEKEFKSVKVKEGKVYKRIDSIYYYPNGILETSVIKDYQFLLSGYDFELPENKIYKRKTNSNPKAKYEQIKKISPLWYWQLKEHYGLKYEHKETYYSKTNFIDDLKFLLKYIELNDENKEMLNNTIGLFEIRNKYNRVYSGWKNLTFSFYKSNSDANFKNVTNYQHIIYSYLTEEEIEIVKNICSCGLSTIETYKKITCFAKEKLKKNKDITIQYLCYANIGYGNYGDIKDNFFDIYNLIRKTQDKNVRKALIKLNLFSEDLFIDEPLTKDDKIIEDKIIDQIISIRY